MAGTRVRRLRERDIDRAIQLTDLERWGYTRADFLRLLALAPKGCFAAERDGRVVGVLSTTAYGPVAYLGVVIVDPALRGQGVGEALMHAALEHLDAVGVETVVLHAYLNVIPFYERFGFRRDWENVRWEGGRVGPGPTSGHPVRSADLDPISELDETFFGSSRWALLERLVSEFPGAFLVARTGGTILGYIVGNASGDSCEVGPWVARPDREGTAGELLRALQAAVDAETFAFSAPGPNASVHDHAKSMGYHEVFRTLRMFRGEDPFRGRPEGIWGFAGLEKG